MFYTIHGLYTPIFSCSPRSAPRGFSMRTVSMGVYSVTYPRPGIYTFKFTATDNHRLTATASISVEVRKCKYYDHSSELY